MLQYNLKNEAPEDIFSVQLSNTEVDDDLPEEFTRGESLYYERKVDQIVNQFLE